MDGLIRKKLSITPLERRLMLDASLPAIAGQVLWLDAADATTVLDADGDNAATGTGGSNNGFGGTVTTWQDKSGSGFHVSATAGQAPVYTTNALNGNSVLTFDGSNDKLTRASASIPGDDFTTFIVFNRTISASRDAVAEWGSGGARNALFINETNNGRMNYYINGGWVHYTSPYVAGTNTLATIVHNTGSINLFNNATNEVSTTGTTRTGTNGLYIGDDSSGGDNLTGYIAEILIYDRDLSADERHDVETYLAGKWGLTINNATPTVATNTGMTLDEGTASTIGAAALSASDTDNTEALLRYTITNATDNGTLRNTNTLQVLGLGDTFTQADINNGYIQYTHNDSSTTSDAFGFSVSDGAATLAGQTFSITVNPVNDAPVIQGWTLVSSEDFEGGAAGWSINTTTNGGAYLSNHLGRFSNDGGVQNVFKTYGLTSGQDYTVIEFDFYRLDSWDNEAFQIYVDDAMIYTQNFGTGAVGISDGSSGSVSWTVTELTTVAHNFAYSTWTDQKFHFTLTIQNDAAANVKLGFSSTVNQGIADESWGIDNVHVYEAQNGGVPGPMVVAENTANGQVVGRITTTDPENDTITYSIIGGTGAGAFAINPTTGAITVSNSALLNYEATPSFTLQIRATDNGSPNLSDTETITVNLFDIPENTAPVVNAAGPFSVAENTANGTAIGTITATDADGHSLSYSISAGNTDNIFSIDAATGILRVNNNTALNFEYDTQYSLTVRAMDNGFGTLFGQRTIVVNITDVNEAPTFDALEAAMAADPYLRYNATTGNLYKYISTASVYATAQVNAAAQTLFGVAGHIATITSASENTFVRGLSPAVMWLDGTDTAVEGNWTWQNGGTENGVMFWQGTGAGSVQNGLYANWAGGEPNNSGGTEDFATMRADGLWNDVSGGSYSYVVEWEGADVLAALNSNSYTVNENSAAAVSAGLSTAQDIDAGDTLAYSITGGTGAGLFAINPSTGEITVANGAILNFEATASYTLDLRVQDTLGLFDTKTVTINLADINDLPVNLDISNASIQENEAAGMAIGTVSAADEDAADILGYTLIDDAGGRFALNGTTVESTASFDYEQGTSYNITLRVDDGSGGVVDRIFTINVLNQPDDAVIAAPPDPIGQTAPAPAAPSTSLDTADNRFILDKLDDTAYGSVLEASLAGEIQQFLAFYGLGSFTQILRENTTFEIRDLTGPELEAPGTGAMATMQSSPLADEIAAVDTPKESQPAAVEDRFTNLREALAFFEQLAESEDDGQEDSAGTNRQSQNPTLPSIDRQFQDVLTYHERRQADLRRALMDA